MKQIPEEIGEYLSYNPETGDLTWIKKTSEKSLVKVGDIAGGKNSRGYAQTTFKGVKYKNHRIAWFLHTGEQPPDDVDHVDGDCANNTAINLRAATHSQNMHNQGRHSNNTSGYKGVSWYPNLGKWSSKIRLNKKLHYLGYFTDIEKAYLAYCKAADELHKEVKRYE